MKGMGNLTVFAVVVILLVVGTYAAGLWTLPGVIPSGCRIMKPVWGYYACEIDPTPVSWENQIFSTATAPEHYIYACTNQDVAVNGMQTPTGTYVSCISNLFYTSSVTAQANCQICQGLVCESQVVKQGQSLLLDFGDRVDCTLHGPLLGSFEYRFIAQYKQKQLVYHDWFGFESETKGVGCDLRSVLPPSEWDKLPQGSKVSMDIGERQNFVVGWTDVASIGNYFTHPTYGDVVCTPQHSLYTLNAFNVIDEAGESGIYYDQAGNCYLVPSENPVGIVECCPGETLVGYTCNTEGKWVPISQGECCIGELCTAIHCPGSGAEYCDISEHKVHRYICRSSDGMCIDELNQYAACCPPDIGCAGDEYCDAETYDCKKKEPGLIPCPFGCCTADYVDLNVYQAKDCASGLTCCPDKQCKADCGVGPPAGAGYEWVWIIILATLGLLIGYSKGAIGAGIGGIVGGIFGYLVYYFLTLPVWMQFLIGIAGVAGAGLITYALLFGGGLITIIVAYSVLRGDS
jgi:hypothetical protein